MSDLTPAELAELFVKQVRGPNGEQPERPHGEPWAINIWEEWICREDPERGWPVYREILLRRTDDETLYQVGVRIGHLLWRHYDQFIDRFRELFSQFPRLWRIMGDDALDRARYTDDPYDRRKLIETYEAYERVSRTAQRLDSVVKANPQRAIRIAIEVIHRAPKHGLDDFDAFEPLHELLRVSGGAVIDEIEQAAKESVLVRRALWDVPRGWSKPPEPIVERCRIAAGTTTKYTDDDAPWPLPRTLDNYDEMLIAAYIEASKTFWAWEDVADLASSNAAEAWAVTRELLERCTEEQVLFAIAAGPLEKLVQDHPEKFDEIAAAARVDANVARALTGVYMFPEYEAYDRFTALLRELDLEKSPPSPGTA